MNYYVILIETLQILKKLLILLDLFLPETEAQSKWHAN